MKTLVDNKTGQSRFIWADDTQVSVDADMTRTLDLYISDMNESNATLVENVTPPEDWAGCKYLYSAGAWTLNPDWHDPADQPPTPQK